MTEITITFKARDYQKPVANYFRKGGKSAYCVWHRKAGKDRTATFIESELAFSRVGLYWHALPKYEDARKVIWDAITPDGKRLIDVNFPPEVIKRRLDHEMKLELINGSIWQPVGVDNYNALVGAFPVHVTYSEYALMHPQARTFLRPAIAMNNGSELLITTPRGYNHAHSLWEYAKTRAEWFTSLLTVDDTDTLSREMLEEERRTMPDELFRQEYYCDWSAANVGSILGRYVEQAEKDGRIGAVDYDPDGAEIFISSDIGRNHVSAFWFWQPVFGGFNIVDYDESAGLDADEWCDRLKEKIGRKRLGILCLPHDARAKTFAAKYSPVETFAKAFGIEHVKCAPRTAKLHSINAGQVVMRNCRFDKERCAVGLNALRSWAYKYDPDRKSYSKEPVDDWAADASDAFCEGAKMLKERIMEVKHEERAQLGLEIGTNKLTLDEVWASHEAEAQEERRIG